MDGQPDQLPYVFLSAGLDNHSKDRSISQVDTENSSYTTSYENNTSISQEERLKCSQEEIDIQEDGQSEHVYENVIMPSRSQRKRNNKKKNKQQLNITVQTVESKIEKSNQSTSSHGSSEEFTEVPSSSSVLLSDLTPLENISVKAESSSQADSRKNETQVTQISDTNETNVITTKTYELQEPHSFNLNEEHSRKYQAKMSLLNTPYPIKHLQKPPTPPIRRTGKLSLKKAQRAALQQYFSPIMSSSRYLDIISEEKTDISGGPSSEVLDSPERILPSTSGMSDRNVSIVPTKVNVCEGNSEERLKVQKDAINTNIRVIPVEIVDNKYCSKDNNVSDNVRIIPIEISHDKEGVEHDRGIKTDASISNVRIIPVEVSECRKQVKTIGQSNGSQQNEHSVKKELWQNSQALKNANDRVMQGETSQQHVRIIPIEINNNSNKEINREIISESQPNVKNNDGTEATKHKVKLIPVELINNKRESSENFNISNEEIIHKNVSIVPREIDIQAPNENRTEAAKQQESCSKNIRIIPIEINKKGDISSKVNGDVESGKRKCSSSKPSGSHKEEYEEFYKQDSCEDIYKNISCASHTNNEQKIRIIPIEIDHFKKLDSSESKSVLSNRVSSDNANIPETVEQINQQHVRLIPIEVDSQSNKREKTFVKSDQISHTSDTLRGSKEQDREDSEENIYENIRIMPIELKANLEKTTKNVSKHFDVSKSKDDQNIPTTIQNIIEDIVTIIPIKVDYDRTEEKKNHQTAGSDENIYENIRIIPIKTETAENEKEETTFSTTRHHDDIETTNKEHTMVEIDNKTNEITKDKLKTQMVPDNVKNEVTILEDLAIPLESSTDFKTDVVSSALTIKTDTSEMNAGFGNLNESENAKISTISKSRSPSEVSEDNSSRGSSLCTAINTGKYNPHSSVGNVESLAVEEETSEVTTIQIVPKTLREICLEFLESLPFGNDMLQELADVAKSIENITDKLSHEIMPKKRAQNLTNASESPQIEIDLTSSNKSQLKEEPVRPKVPERKSKKIIVKTEDPKVNRNNESPIHTLLGILKDESNQTPSNQRNLPEENLPYLHYHQLKTLTLPHKMRLYKDGRMENDFSKPRSLSEQHIHHIRAPTTTPRNLQPIKEDKILSRQPFSWERKVNQKSVSEANLSRPFSNVTLPQNVRLYKDGRMHGNTSYALQNAYEQTQSEFNLTDYGLRSQSRFDYDSDINYDSEPSYKPRRIKCPMQKPFRRTVSYDSEPNYDSEDCYTPKRPKTPLDFDFDSTNRRYSLPQELYQEQLVGLLEKERHIQRELEQLEDEKQKLYSELSQPKKYKSESCLTYTKDELKGTPDILPSLDSEVFRNKMYEEYLNQMAVREERLENNILKVSSKRSAHISESDRTFEVVHVSGIEQEFMNKVKEKQNIGKLFKKDDSVACESDKETEEDTVLIMDGNSLEKVKRLPKHLKEFANLTKYAAEKNGVWSPGQSQENLTYTSSQSDSKDEPIVPVWTPQSSPVLEKKQFKPVNFGPVKLKTSQTNKVKNSASSENLSTQRSWNPPGLNSDAQKSFSLEKLGPPVPRLPKIQNPTITLLQKAREGKLPRISRSVETINKQEETPLPQREISKFEKLRPEPVQCKIDGIGPVTKDGMPVILRSEVRDADQSRWYKKMYDTIHKQRKHNDEYVTVRYKPRRAQCPYTSGYVSEPGSLNYDSDFGERKSATFDRTSTSSLRDHPSSAACDRLVSTVPRNMSNKSWSSNDNIKSNIETQPRSIESYHPGKSSITGKEAKKWWDEVMDIFDGQFEEEEKKLNQTRKHANPSLKESGYESDSLLVFRRKENNNLHQPDPLEQREVYKSIQKGGDVPLHGLRKLAPEKPKDDVDLKKFFLPSSDSLLANIEPQKEIFCFPVTVHYPRGSAGSNKREDSSESITRPPLPPSPPKRKSSHNNKTLRLISNMKVRADRSSHSKRHEICFINTTNIDNERVKYLRDKITYKLSYPQKKKSEPEKQKSKLIKKSSIPDTVQKNTSKSSSSLSNKFNIQIPKKVSEKNKKNPETIVRKSKTTKDKTVHKSKTPSDKRKNELDSTSIASSSKLVNTDIKLRRSMSKERKQNNNEAKQALSTFSSLKKAAKNVCETAFPIRVTFTENGRKIIKSTLKRPYTSILKEKSLELDKYGTAGTLEQEKTIRLCQPMVKYTQKTPEKLHDQHKLNKTYGSSDLAGTSSFSLIDDIENHTRRIKSDHFFRHLLLRDVPTTLSTLNLWLRKPTRYEQRRACEPTVNAMKVYLNHTRPVSDSKFLSLDMLRSRSASPKSVKWRNETTSKFEEKERIRSSSLPTKMFFSQTSRPISPIVRKASDPPTPPPSPLPHLYPREPSPKRHEVSKIILTETSRPVSPIVERKQIQKFHKTNTRSKSAESYVSSQAVSKQPAKIILTETSRPVSPVVERRAKSLADRAAKERSRSAEGFYFDTLSCSREMSSYRPQKIILTETSRPVSPIICSRKQFREKCKSTESIYSDITSSSRETLRYEPKKLIFSETSRPVSPIIERKTLPKPVDQRSKERSKSTGSYYYPISVHQEMNYANEPDSPSDKQITHHSRYCNKFKKLNDFYSDIERIGKLEKSSCWMDFKPRKRNEDEIIDYERWKQVRSRERTERELNSLYTHLSDFERRNGFLFRSKLNNVKWKKEFDRGLRIKEKSVDDIKEEFERIKERESSPQTSRKYDTYFVKDTYKPLWRGHSVVNVVDMLTKRRSQSEGRESKKLSNTERMLTHGIGSRIWSSLSMEQVDVLKEQLADIYNQKSKNLQEHGLYMHQLHVPSLDKVLDKNPILETNKFSKTQADSISLSCPAKVWDVDKKLLSQNIGKEILSKVKSSNSHKCIEESLEKNRSSPPQIENVPSDNRDEKKLPVKPLVSINALSPPTISSASENESASTDDSTRTVIKRNESNIIGEKVDYFEKISFESPYIPTVYKPAENGDCTIIEKYGSENLHKSNDVKPNRLASSRSYEDFKELFGEQESARYATVPSIPPERSSSQKSLSPLIQDLENKISKFDSYDSLSRSRSLSPFSDKSTTSLKSEEIVCSKSNASLSPIASRKPRRLRPSKSDSHVHSRNFFSQHPLVDVNYLRSKYEHFAQFGKSMNKLRRGGVVSPLFLRARDRLMPHINIISKIANLCTKRYATEKEKNQSSEELAQSLGCPVGEVIKLREKFEVLGKDISLLGHMYTSAPDLKELSHVSPYLSASWIAHRYPKLEDNIRSLSSPEDTFVTPEANMVRNNVKSKSAYISPRKKTSLPQDELHRASKHSGTNQALRSKTQQKGESERLDNQKLKKESQRKYIENNVTIHYKTPVMQEIKEYLNEDELARRQAESLKKSFEEERRRKYLQVSKSLQELEDINNRRHSDNFIPCQKSPIPLDRYDNIEGFPTERDHRRKSPEHRLVAKASFNFVGQSPRELTFRKGDLIYVRRQIDKNWYEGEINAMIGLFPANYVEIKPFEEVKTTPRKSYEGQARAKYNFVAQTHLELSLAKGELVVITRKVDENWFEGKIGGKKGIFPVSYVEVLIDPSDSSQHNNNCSSSPALQLSETPHRRPPVMEPSTTPRAAKSMENGAYGSVHRNNEKNYSQQLHIETPSEPIPYRALFRYLPQNEDELELMEGDTVYVLEKCDDGWYVGSSERTGAFGTFPGNYVEKM